MAYDKLLKPAVDAFQEARDIQQENRNTHYFNHVSAVTDGALVLAWPSFENRPWVHVEEALSCAQYFGNKILAQEINKYDLYDSYLGPALTSRRESLQARWVKAFYDIFSELVVYLREYYPHGLTWVGKSNLSQEILLL